MEDGELAVVVLAGGAGRRMGAAAKPLLRVGGVPLLTRVLDAAAAARARVVVGPPDLAPALRPGVLLTREEPPGGGPVAGLAAGLAALRGAGPAAHVAVLAADLPFLTGDVLAALHRAAGRPHVDGAVLVDGEGQPQLLCGVWATDRLDQRLAELGPPAGVSIRRLVAPLRVTLVRAPVTTPVPPWYDCDTVDDLRVARDAAGDDGEEADR